jgi:hypothetical protein
MRRRGAHPFENTTPHRFGHGWPNIFTQLGFGTHQRPAPRSRARRARAQGQCRRHYEIGGFRRPKADPCSPCRSRARQQPTGARHAPLAGRLAVRLHRGRRAKERGHLLEEKWRHCVSITLDRLPNSSRNEGPPAAALLFLYAKRAIGRPKIGPSALGASFAEALH